jgi:hypothetical protein
MAATAIAGKGGSLRVVGTPDTTVGEITEWTCEIDRENYDSTALGADFKTNVIGLGSWQGTAKGFFAISTDQGQTILQNAILNGSTVYVELRTSTDVYEGQVNPTKVSVGNPVSGLVTFEFDFVGTGALLYS